MRVSLVDLPSVALIYRYRSLFNFTSYDLAVLPVTITVSHAITELITTMNLYSHRHLFLEEHFINIKRMSLVIVGPRMSSKGRTSYFL